MKAMIRMLQNGGIDLEGVKEVVFNLVKDPSYGWLPGVENVIRLSPKIERLTIQIGQGQGYSPARNKRVLVGSPILEVMKRLDLRELCISSGLEKNAVISTKKVSTKTIQLDRAYCDEDSWSKVMEPLISNLESLILNANVDSSPIFVGGKKLKLLATWFTKDLNFDSLTSLTHLKLRCFSRWNDIDSLLSEIESVLPTQLFHPLQLELVIIASHETIRHSGDHTIFDTAAENGITIELIHQN